MLVVKITKIAVKVIQVILSILKLEFMLSINIIDQFIVILIISISGGPLMATEGSDDSEDGNQFYYLVGVVSFGAKHWYTLSFIRFVDFLLLLFKFQLQ